MMVELLVEIKSSKLLVSLLSCREQRRAASVGGCVGGWAQRAAKCDEVTESVSSVHTDMIYMEVNTDNYVRSQMASS